VGHRRQHRDGTFKSNEELKEIYGGKGITLTAR